MEAARNRPLAAHGQKTPAASRHVAKNTGGQGRGPSLYSGLVSARNEEAERKDDRVAENQLAFQAKGPDARLYGRGGPDCRRGATVQVSAACLRRRGAPPQKPSCRRGPGRGFPASGRRLRREFRTVFSRCDPRHLQGDAANAMVLTYG